jgi:hypothetical protein
MSGPVQPPLEVTDGTTSVRPTRSITFDAADGFTVMIMEVVELE